VTTPSAAQVASFYPDIRQPPHPYYELKNRKQDSHFPPGESAEFYAPFIAYFEERLQTAEAQRRRYQKKLNGPGAHTFKLAADGWRLALRTARMRQEKAIDRAIVAEQPGRPPFEWDDEEPAAPAQPSSELERAVQTTLF